MNNNIICNRCYNKDIISKKLLKENNNYICKLCNKNIFFYTIFFIKNNDIIKELILKIKNNSKECALKECGEKIEDFEKKSILICCKCILEKDTLKINNYSVDKPDIMCMMCNYSCCSRYNFHINCSDKFICTSCDSLR